MGVDRLRETRLSASYCLYENKSVPRVAFQRQDLFFPERASSLYPNVMIYSENEVNFQN